MASPSILALAREIVELTHHGSLRWETTRDQVAAILMRREVDWAHEYALMVEAVSSEPSFSDLVGPIRDYVEEDAVEPCEYGCGCPDFSMCQRPERAKHGPHGRCRSCRAKVALSRAGFRG